MGYEATYFFRHNEAAWGLSQIEDLKDADVARYAVLASFMETLVASFNWKIEQGLRRDRRHAVEICDKDGYELFLETAPIWTNKVESLAEVLDLRPPNSKDGLNAVFGTRNIEAPMGYLYSV